MSVRGSGITRETLRPENPMIALPNKLSDLLELAVHDAQKCEALPEIFVLNMGEWHKPVADGSACSICMAGAVIAQTIGLANDVEAVVWTGRPTLPELEPYRAQLVAINEMRLGDFGEAANVLEIPLTQQQQNACESLFEQIQDDLPWEEDDEDREEGNAPNMRAPWSMYLEAVVQLREVGL